MINSKYFLIVLTLFTVIGVTSIVSPVKAAEDQGAYPSLIQRIMEKFKLNKSEVDSVITEEREAFQNERHQFMEQKIDEAVNNGKLNVSQKQELLKKLEEKRMQNETFRQQRQSERVEFENWAKEKGIDLDEIGLGRRGGMGGAGAGSGMGYGKGMYR
jgi:hypothetical protein